MKFSDCGRSSGASRRASSMRLGMVTAGFLKAATRTSSWSSSSSLAISPRQASTDFSSTASWKAPSAYRRATLLPLGTQFGFLDGFFDQLLVLARVQVLTNDAGRGLYRQVGDLRPQLLDRFLALTVDFAAGLGHDLVGLLFRLLLKLLTKGLPHLGGLVDHGPRLDEPDADDHQDEQPALQLGLPGSAFDRAARHQPIADARTQRAQPEQQPEGNHRCSQNDRSFQLCPPLAIHDSRQPGWRARCTTR